MTTAASSRRRSISGPSLTRWQNARHSPQSSRRVEVDLATVRCSLANSRALLKRLEDGFGTACREQPEVSLEMKRFEEKHPEVTVPGEIWQPESAATCLRPAVFALLQKQLAYARRYAITESLAALVKVLEERRV